MIYGQFLRFLLPLVITVVVQELSGQFLTGGMARVPQATETLASYGLAWGLVSLLISPLTQVKQLGLVLVESRQAFARVQLFVVISGLLLASVLGMLALSPLGDWVIEDLHHVNGSLGDPVREALLWLAPMPLIRGLTLYHAGLLLRIRRTDLVSLAILVSIGASVAAVFGLLPVSFIRERPILLPLLVIYAGALSELAVILWGIARHALGAIPAAGPEIRLPEVVRFFWPLALIMVIQGLSRPLINLYVSRETDGAESLATLTVIYSLAHVLYGWLNEIRSLPPAFRGRDETLVPIFRFGVACGLVSFALMAALFWTPAREFVLGNLLGVNAELTARARVPLIIFSYFPLTVMIRAYLHGVGLLERRTRAMAPSAFARVIAILVVLVVAPAFGLNGATRGITALFSGFVFETFVVWLGIRGRNSIVAMSQTGRPSAQPGGPL
jgi:hypothetical protein